MNILEQADPLSVGIAVTILALVFLFGLACAFTLNTWMLRRNGKVNQRRGRRAERNAADLLEEEGFAVLDTQPRIASPLRVNGDPEQFVVTPDMLVEKDGVRYVVEVKVHDDRAGITSAAVRRQVIEYMHATGMPCLLINMPEGDIDLIEFTEPR